MSELPSVALNHGTVHRGGRVLAPTITVAIALIAWHWYSSTAGSVLLPGPMRVVTSGWTARGDLWANALPTLRAALLGFALAVAIGFVLSVLIDFFEPVRNALMPLLIVSQTLPIIVIAPLMVLWFGFGLLPKVLLVALVTFFPITVALVRGYSAAGEESHEVMTSLGATRWQEFVGLRIHCAIPSFFTGVRIAITYAIVAAIFAENAGAIDGLGIYMQVAKNSFRTDVVIAATVVTALLTLVLYALTFVIEGAALRYRRRGTA